MKNKKVNVKVLSPNGIVDMEKSYSELLSEAINNTPTDGFTIGEMRERFVLLDVLEKSNGEINFDAIQLKKIQKLVSEMRWKFMSKSIIQFVDDIVK